MKKLTKKLLGDIWMYGDPHNDFTLLNQLLVERKPKAVFLLGDTFFEEYKPRNKVINNCNAEIFAIVGNHEGDRCKRHAKTNGIKWINGKLFTYCGIRFYHVDCFAISDLQKLVDSGNQCDVIISHYPVGHLLKDAKKKQQYIPCQNGKLQYKNELVELYKKSGALLWFHGHYHQWYGINSPLFYNGVHCKKLCCGEVPSINAANYPVSLNFVHADYSSLNERQLADFYLRCFHYRIGEFELPKNSKNLWYYDYAEKKSVLKVTKKALKATREHYINLLLDRSCS